MSYIGRNYMVRSILRTYAGEVKIAGILAALTTAMPCRLCGLTRFALLHTLSHAPRHGEGRKYQSSLLQNQPFLHKKTY